MKIQFDRKRFLALTVSFITIFLFGCSPAILVELRNDGRETIHVRDAIKGLVSISPGQTALLDSGLRLSIEGPSKRAYELRKVPSKYVQTEKLGYVIYAILDNEGTLHLAKRINGQQLVRIEPQPDGFPLKEE